MRIKRISAVVSCSGRYQLAGHFEKSLPESGAEKDVLTRVMSLLNVENKPVD